MKIYSLVRFYNSVWTSPTLCKIYFEALLAMKASSCCIELPDWFLKRVLCMSINYNRVFATDYIYLRALCSFSAKCIATCIPLHRN